MKKTQNIFKKFRTKRVYFVKKSKGNSLKTTFFSKIFTKILQISRKLLNRFLWLFFGPLRGVKTTSFGKKSKKNRFFLSKNLASFFFDRILEDFFILSDFAEIGSFIVQDKYICVIFEFSDFAQKWWKKIRFKFEIWKIVVKKYPVREAFFWEKNIAFSFKKIRGIFIGKKKKKRKARKR